MRSILKSSLYILDPRRDSSVTKYRLIIAASMVVILSLVVLGRLYFLQVMNYDRYSTLSSENRLGILPIPPIRGWIFDRNGSVLARNYPVYDLELVPDKVPDINSTIKEISNLIDLNDTEISRFLRGLENRPTFESHLLKMNLSHEQAALVAVNQHRFAGVTLTANLRRFYPYDGLFAHAIGYVSRISEGDLQDLDRSSYSGTRYIGRLGIEAKYEKQLFGAAGYDSVEFNAHGRVVRSVDKLPPSSGWNAHLTLDAEIQKVTRGALGGRRGAAVVLRPDTGDVLAFVSSPDYDPNLFASGFGKSSYEDLRSSPDKPLLNRALHGRYAPGSTIKPLLAVAALNEGLGSDAKVFCNGEFYLSGRERAYRCWNRDGHGAVSLLEAIERSCDLFFYQLAVDLGIDRMSTWLGRFGLGRMTGIGLDDETNGLVPSRDWKKETRGEAWFPGETVIAGIGQGYLLATPLQLAVATSAIANRGAVVQPRLLSHFENSETGEIVLGPEVRFISNVVAEGKEWNTVIDGMVAVVHGLQGTARSSGAGSPYRIAGKTGTSQLISIGQEEEYDSESVPEHLRDHALFVAFAPVEKPSIVLAIVIENGGSGSKVAAPIARKILDYYFIERLRRATSERKGRNLG
mgnify:CR=1 FL=1